MPNIILSYRWFSVIVAFLSTININAQTKGLLGENNAQSVDKKLLNSTKQYVMETIMKDIPTINADYEFFDRDYFFLGKERRGEAYIYDKHRKRVVGNDTFDVFSKANEYEERDKNGRLRRKSIDDTGEGVINDITFFDYPAFWVRRTFYQTGGIKRKGVQGFMLQIGQWYHYDEDGNLIEIVDYDKEHRFTAADALADVLVYCLMTGIKVGEYSPSINRYIKRNNLIWIIIGYLASDLNMMVQVEIDVRQWRVINRTENKVFPHDDMVTD